MAISMLKRALLLFWAVWLTFVVAGNVCDALKELGFLGAEWQFASGNYEAIVKTTGRYPTPEWLNAVLFAGVIVWEAATAALFWLAWWDAGREGAKESRYMPAAFLLSVGLWSAFVIADEICVAYPLVAVHFRILIASLASLLTIYVLPDE